MKTGKEVLAYHRYSRKVLCELKSTQIHESKANTYFIYGKFTCESNEVNVLVEGPFPNRFVAEEASKKIADGSYLVWINSKQPQIGVLKKHFPLKSLISSFILFGLIVYFLFLFLRIKKTYG